MRTTETLAEVRTVKERIARLSSETEVSATGSQAPLTKDAAKCVRAKLLAAVVSLDEASTELTRMLGAQVAAALEDVRGPGDCVELVRSLKACEFDAETQPFVAGEPELALDETLHQAEE